MGAGHVYSGHVGNSFYVTAAINADSRQAFFFFSKRFLLTLAQLDCVRLTRQSRVSVGGASLAGMTSVFSTCTQTARPAEAPIKLDSHVADVNAVAWCPSDTTTLLSCSDDATIRIWSASKTIRSNACDVCDRRTRQRELRDVPGFDIVGRVSTEPTGSGMSQASTRGAFRFGAPNLQSTVVSRGVLQPGWPVPRLTHVEDKYLALKLV